MKVMTVTYISGLLRQNSS